jgi:hypothetical protein
MNTLIAERIINSLESGIVPVNDVHYFSIGRKDQDINLDNLLKATKNGESKILFIHGDYGIGKTHILALTRLKALKMDFLVSHVTLSSRENPLSKLTWVYFSILKNLTYGDLNKPGSMMSFLDLWLGLAERKVLKYKSKPCRHNLTYETCALGCFDDLYKQHMPELEEIDGDLRNAIKFYQHAFLRDNVRLKEMIVRWMLGDKLTKGEYKWISSHIPRISIYKNIDSDGVFRMFKSISSLGRILGFNGFAILLDEAERIPSIHNVLDGYINLMSLIVQSLGMPGVCIIYATTPQFYNDARQYLGYFETEDNKKVLKFIYDRMEKERINLSPLDPDELILLSEKILRIYLLSRGLEAEVNSHSIWSVISEAIKPLCQNRGTLRDFIAEILPIMKKHVSP